MRLSDPIEKAGFFWLPSHPEEQFPGNLRISESGEVSLQIVHRSTMLDSQLLDSGTPIGKEPPRILGIVDDNPVTLQGCIAVHDPFQLFRLMEHHVFTSRFHIGAAFVGAPFVDDELISFSKVDFSIEGLSEWFSISGFHTEINHDLAKAEWSLHYTQPDDISILLPDGIQLKFEFDPKFSFPDSRVSQMSSEISQHMHISLVSDRLLPIEAFHTIIHKIQVFLILVLDKVVSIEWVKGYSVDKLDKKEQEIATNIYYHSQLQARQQDAFVPMICSYNEISDNLESMLGKWFADYEIMQPAFDLYLSSKAGSYKYFSGVFLALMQALETLHRRLSNETQMETDDFEKLRADIMRVVPPDRRKFVESKLEYANEISLRKRLKQLICPFAEFYGTSREIKILIRKTIIVRNYLTHYDRKSERKAKQIIDDDLLVICLKLEALFQLHFLHLTGMSVSRVKSIASKNTVLRHRLGLDGGGS